MPFPLPLDWVDRLFGRLAVRYGADWLRQWEGLDMTAVKADWADALAGLQARPEALKYGLDHLPSDRPPNVAQFKAACNRMPVPAPLTLRGPVASPGVVARVREAIGGAVRRDPRAWARKLEQRHLRGDRLTVTQVEMYRDALKQRRDEAAPR